MNLEEYKRTKYKYYTLPSGLKIKAKNLSPYSIYKIRNEIAEKDKLAEAFSNPDIITKLFKEFIVDPKIPEEISMDDFSSEDFNAIYAHIMEQVLVTKSKKLEEVVASDKDFHI